MSDTVKAGFFALGALSRRERTDLSLQRMIDPLLDAQIDEGEAMFAPLAGAAGEKEPPASLKARVMAAIMMSDHLLGEGKQLAPFDAGNWRNIFPGIEVKRLWGKGPFLMRCAPETIVPAHDHPEHEHLVVISGDFWLEGREYSVGDHLSSPPGSRHDPATTQKGCILLVHCV